MTQHLSSATHDMDRAADLLRDGALVAFPTETVYGLGADATNGTAVAGIFAAKGRPSFNPLIVHVPDKDAARQLTEWSDTAEHLATAFWPGPLTLVLPLRAGSGISELVSAGLQTIAIRVPASATAQALLHAAQTPIAAPSANPSGKISPTTAQHVLDGLNGKIAAVVDDGPCGVGLESTIVGLAGTPTLLRPGGLDQRDIERCLGQPLASAGDGITAPGQMDSHYAPTQPVRLNAQSAKPGECHLGFGAVSGDFSLSESGDLKEAAANLFSALHTLNGLGKPIAIAPVPNVGLGIAINDRLSRAAAPRP